MRKTLILATALLLLIVADYSGYGEAATTLKRAAISVKRATKTVKKLDSRAARLLKWANAIHNFELQAALSDCVDLQDMALDGLRLSYKSMANWSYPLHSAQLNDVQTWVSAALTDQDTCKDDLQDFRNQHKIKGFYHKLARAESQLSTALAFINSLH